MGLIFYLTFAISEKKDSNVNAHAHDIWRIKHSLIPDGLGLDERRAGAKAVFWGKNVAVTRATGRHCLGVFTGLRLLSYSYM